MNCIATARRFVSRVFDQQACSLEHFAAAFKECLQALKHDSIRAYSLMLRWAYRQPENSEVLTVKRTAPTLETLLPTYRTAYDVLQGKSHV